MIKATGPTPAAHPVVFFGDFPTSAVRSAAARRALGESLSLQRSTPPRRFLKLKSGALRNHDGFFLSLSHKPNCVAGVAARSAVGVDVEEISTGRSRRLFMRVARPNEWAVLHPRGTPTWGNFAELWSAKEAILKLFGHGIGALADIRISQISRHGTESRLVFTFRRKVVFVRQWKHRKHVISLASQSEPMLQSSLYARVERGAHEKN